MEVIIIRFVLNGIDVSGSYMVLKILDFHVKTYEHRNDNLRKLRLVHKKYILEFDLIEYKNDLRLLYISNPFITLKDLEFD